MFTLFLWENFAATFHKGPWALRKHVAVVVSAMAGAEPPEPPGPNRSYTGKKQARVCHNISRIKYHQTYFLPSEFYTILAYCDTAVAARRGYQKEPFRTKQSVPGQREKPTLLSTNKTNIVWLAADLREMVQKTYLHLKLTVEFKTILGYGLKPLQNNERGHV